MTWNKVACFVALLNTNPRLSLVSNRGIQISACTPRCFGYRNHTPESPALPMQSPAVSRSRHLTVCDGVSVCASAIVPDIRCLGYRNLTLETSSPSSQSSAVASPGPAKCCARSTSPLCHVAINFRARSGHKYHSVHATPLLRPNAHILRLPFEL